MRVDWVPFSASALVAGATALSVGAILNPSSGDAADLIRAVREDGGVWMAIALLYFFAAAALTGGMPSILTLFDRRGMRTGLAAIGILTIGCVGIAGYAMVLAFVRALVIGRSIDPATFEDAVSEPGFAILLYGWVGAFYLGELLLAVALLRAGTTGRWIPALLLAHAALFPIGGLLPDTARALTALLVTVALSGVGITANARRASLP